MSIIACPTFVSASITGTLDLPGGPLTSTVPIYSHLRPNVWHGVYPAPTGYALFAGAQLAAPDAVLKMAGSGGILVQGDVHSNTDIFFGGHGSIQGAVTAVKGFDGAPQNWTFTSSNPGVAPRVMPINCGPDDLGPATFSFIGDVNLTTRQEVWEDFSARKLKSGIYRATGQISLSGSGPSGVVTFIADSIQISASSVSLAPYSGGVTLLATGTGERSIDLSGAGASIIGAVYAPIGGVDMTGAGAIVRGAVIAQRINKAAAIVLISFAVPP